MEERPHQTQLGGSGITVEGGFMALGDPTKAQQFCFHPNTKATCKEPSKTFYSIESFQNESHQQYVGPKERGFSRTGPGRLETRGVKGCELLEEDSTEVSCHRREGVDILAYLLLRNPTQEVQGRNAYAVWACSGYRVCLRQILHPCRHNVRVPVLQLSIHQPKITV